MDLNCFTHRQNQLLSWLRSTAGKQPRPQALREAAPAQAAASSEKQHLRRQPKKAANILAVECRNLSSNAKKVKANQNR